MHADSGTTTSPSAATANRDVRLVALSRDGAAGRWRDLGSYPDLDSALLARVEDVLAQLAANDGWLITCEHLVIGHDAGGVPTVASHVTQLGADPASDAIPAPHNEPETRRWLLAASGLHNRQP
jgi:hypothetical protein